MAASSLDELKGKVAAGEYAIDAGMVAGTILSNFSLIRRVGRTLRSEDEDGGTGEDRPGPPNRRRERPAPHPLRPRSERLQ
jgi:hypothetical protein